MKVVCGSCGAKYSVADDKVAGKTVKIRCKKCSEVIVVHGEQNGFEEDEATRVFDYGGEAVWHAVVNGEQQGPFTPLQVGGLLMDGKVDAEAYVWKEGFDGWKALRDVPELASLIASKGEATEVAAEPESEPDLFGAKPAGGAASAGADLFAGAGKSSSAFAAGDDDDGVVASKPSPRVSAQEASMTGQRNENSVLFSLSNLQALATGPAPGGGSSSTSSGYASSSSSSGSSAAASKPAGHAVGEASGLIDIRALASATSSLGASKPSGGGSANMDDLLSIGGGASPLTSGLVAPVFAPVQPKREVEEKKSSPLPIIVGIFGVVMIGAVGFLGYKVMNPAPPQVVERIVQVPGEAPVNGAAPTGDAPAENANGTGAAAPDPATTGTTGRTTGTTGRTTGTTGTTGRTGTTGTANTTGTTAPAATTGRTATTGTTAPTTTSAADAMRAALNMTAAPATTTAEPAMTAAPAGAAQPSRSEIAAALGGVSGAVRACGDGTPGVASVNVTFRSTGAVSGAAVTGQFAGTPVGSCIARAVRGAHVPPFSNPTFSVTYPYRL